MIDDSTEETSEVLHLARIETMLVNETKKKLTLEVGHERITFLLDTGVSRTVIHKDERKVIRTIYFCQNSKRRHP